MDWSNERYVRLYTRDTGDMMAVGWEGRLVFYEILRKMDRAGVLDTQDQDVISALIRVPKEITVVGLNRLLERGCLERGLIAPKQEGDDPKPCLVMPNFLEAQEATQSNAQRQRESRQRRRDRTRQTVWRNAGSQEAVGHVYFVQSVNGGPIKIGFATDVVNRIASLQTAQPDELVCLLEIPAVRSMERDLHDRFTRIRGEWFAADRALCSFIRSHDYAHAPIAQAVGRNAGDTNRDETERISPPVVTPSLAEPNQAKNPPTPLRLVPESSRTDRDPIELVVADFNRLFERQFKAGTYADLVKKAIKAGYTVQQLKAAAWAAQRKCADSPEVLANFTPKSVWRLKSRDGKTTLPEWLDMADELWPQVYPGKPIPWRNAC